MARPADVIAAPFWRRRWFEALGVAALAAVLIPIAVPFLREGFPLTHDGATHLTYAYHLDRALHQGQFPVRWVESLTPGHGQPLFNYYQSGFYYFVAALHEVVPRLLVALKAATVLVWWSGAAFMFLLCRRLGTFAATAAAGVFALSPYLITDVFVRGALAEVAAIVAATASLWLLDRFLVTGSTRRLAAVAVALAVTATCHLAASLVLAPVFLALVSWLWIDGQTSRRRIAAAAGAAIAAVGVSAFYLGPAVLEMPLVQMDRFTMNGTDYRQHFVPAGQLVRYTASFRWSYGGSVTNPASLLPVHVSLLEWLLMGTALVVIIRGLRRQRAPATARGLLVWLGLVPVAFFVMSGASAWLWDRVPAFALLQFPWKFFVLVTFATSLLAALLVAAIPRRGLQALAMAAIIAVQALVHVRQLEPVQYGDVHLYDVDGLNWRQDPRVQEWIFIDRALDPVGAADTPTVEGRWKIDADDATIGAEEMLDHRVSLRVNAPSGGCLTLHTPYFPGWVVRVNGTATPVRGRPHDLYMDINLPPGTHLVEARFEDTPVRAWSNRISVVSLCAVVLLALRRRRFV